MGFSTQFYFFILFSCLEFLFLIGPAIYYRIARKEKLFTSIIQRSFPQKRSVLSRIADIGIGIASGVFLSFLARGFLYASILSILNIFGEEFYNTASSGSIDVIPTILSAGEITVTILINFLVIGLCEEYFFRGVLFLELKKIMKNWSYVVNGLVFALYHVFPGIVPYQTTLTYFFYYFVLGILLCVLLDTSNNDLLPNIIAHGVFNSIPLLFSI